MLTEVKHYLEILDYLRGQLIAQIEGLPAEALNWRPIQDESHATNSLAVLAAHVAGAERFWIAEVIGRFPRTRNRKSEFVAVADTAANLIERLEAVSVETTQVLSGLTAVDLDDYREVEDDKSVTVRWTILHVIEHTALHLGHAELTRQLWQSAS